MEAAVNSGTLARTQMERILLVEDHADTRALMTRLLRARGYEVRAAAGFADAIELGRTFSPDLLIADIHLPDGNGLDLLPCLRQSHSTLQGIIFSAHDPWQAVELARAAGYSTCLTKPASFEKLHAAAQYALRLSPATAGAAEQPLQTAEGVLPVSCIE